jgi:hypothetical protein
MTQQALFARFSEAYSSLHADVADLRVDLFAEICKIQAEIIGKIDALQHGIGVNMGIVDAL